MPLITMSMLRELPLHDIPEGPPYDFSPVQVIHRELYRVQDGAPRYRDIDRPTPVPGPQFSIREFAKNVALNGHSRNPPPPIENEENIWTSIKVSRDSYVVVELSRTLAWTFTTLRHDDNSVQEGITLKGLSDDHPEPLSHYGDLHYVDGFGVDYDRPIANSRVAYFSAKPMRGPAGTVIPYEQYMFYVVDQPGGAHEYIDPDIRFPGNGSG